MNTAIVTGANGFVGSHVVRNLVEHGVVVYAVVREGADCSSLPSSALLHVVYCNLNEIAGLPTKIARNDIDVFYHFAWDGTSGQNRGDYSLQLRNVSYSCDAVTVAKQIGCRKFVYAGSIMEYECIEGACVSDRKPGLGNIYSVAKLSARLMAETVASNKNIDFVSAIISNIYGEGERSVRFIVSTLKKLINNERLSCTSGEQLYDFIHIDDASEAFYLIGKYGSNLDNYYIGSETPKPLKEFICEMRDVIAPSVEIGFGEVANNGVSLSYKEFDTSKLYKKLGFVQRVSFEDGVKRTAEWLSNVVAVSSSLSNALSPSSNFTFIETKLDDAKIIIPFFRADNRGYFLKNFEKDIYKTNGLIFETNEDFYSYSKKGVIRGLHFQHQEPQSKIVSVLSGTIFDVIVDLRPSSMTFGQWQGFYLSHENHHLLYVPKGFAHGFQVVSDDAVVLYKCMERFVSEYDGGIKWNDETLAIDWPIKSLDSIIVSDKDSNLPTFNGLNWHDVFPISNL